MNIYEALEVAGQAANLSMAKISRASGRADNYIGAQKSRGSAPSVYIAAELFAPAGYVLAAIPAENVPSNALIIDEGANDE